MFLANEWKVALLCQTSQGIMQTANFSNWNLRNVVSLPSLIWLGFFRTYFYYFLFEIGPKIGTLPKSWAMFYFCGSEWEPPIKGFQRWGNKSEPLAYWQYFILYLIKINVVDSNPVGYRSLTFHDIYVFNPFPSLPLEAKHLTCRCPDRHVLPPSDRPANANLCSIPPRCCGKPGVQPTCKWTRLSKPTGYLDWISQSRLEMEVHCA